MFVDTIARSVSARMPGGEGPLGIAVNPHTGTVYVADWYRHELLAIDPATRDVTKRVNVGNAPSGIAVSPDGSLVLTADRESDAVSFIDADKFQRTDVVPVGTHPFGISIEKSGARAYVANVMSNDVTVLDLKSRKSVATVKVGSRPYVIAFAKNNGFVTNQGNASVSVIDLEQTPSRRRSRLTTIPKASLPTTTRTLSTCRAGPTTRWCKSTSRHSRSRAVSRSVMVLGRSVLF